MPFGLVVRFVLADGMGQEFDALVARTVAKIREAEPDTLVYACHVVDGRPRERVFYELYRDRRAFDAHERQPHIRAFLAERERYVERLIVDRLDLIEAKGVL